MSRISTNTDCNQFFKLHSYLRLLPGDFGFDLVVGDDAAFLEIDEEHAPRLQPALAKDIFGRNVEDPDLGTTTQIGVPIHLLGTPGAIQGPRPRVGEHNDDRVVGQAHQMAGRIGALQVAEPDLFFQQLLSVAHISVPGIGRVAASGSGYTWLPVNYSVLPK